MNALRAASSIKNSAAEHSVMRVTAYIPYLLLRDSSPKGLAADATL